MRNKPEVGLRRRVSYLHRSYPHAYWGIEVWRPQRTMTHVQKSRTSNFARLHSDCFAMVLITGFYSVPGLKGSESSNSQIHSCVQSIKSRWSKILPQLKMATKTAQRKKLSNNRFCRQFRCFLDEILYSEGLGFKPCSRSVFINRINSKFFKRGEEEYAFTVDKNTLKRS